MRLLTTAIASLLALSGRVLGMVKGIRPVRAALTPDLPVQYYELPIDHNNTVSGTFKNRWWFNDTFYQSGGPVILFDAGETDASLLLDYLSEQEGVRTSVMQLAQKYHGIGLLWEHRYYGRSVPFAPDDAETSYDYSQAASQWNETQWSFFTIEQALEDVVSFASNFSLPSNASAASRVQGPDSLRPNQTPWIFVGGSYPGVRSALMRMRNPGVIYASWASSAPVQSVVNGHGYYDQVERALSANCSASIIAAVQYADNAMSDLTSDAAKEVQDTVFETTNLGYDENISNDTAVGLALQLPFQTFQTYGLRSIRPLCDNLETSFNKSSPSDVGIAAKQGSKVAFEYYVGALGFWLNSTLGDLVNNRSQPLGPSAAIINRLETLSWYYQVSTEFGDYPVANPDTAKSIISKFVTVEVAQKQYESYFPNITLPSSPVVEKVNRYGGWNMNPSRTFWNDPWAAFSVASAYSNGLQRKANSTIPTADTSPADGSYYGTIYAGQVHAEDMFSSPNNTLAANAAFEEGLRMFTQALDLWLPAFKSVNGSTTTSAGSPNPTNGVSARSAPGWAVTLAVFFTAAPLLPL